MKPKEKTGVNVHRVDGLDKVLGKALFAADIKMEGLFHIRVLRSDRPHARIKKVYTEKAARLEGVVKILTHSDIPGEKMIGVITRDQPVLAIEKVRFVGDPIALVVAYTEKEADLALEKITVEYEDLVSIFDPEEALHSSNLIHESGNLLFQRDIIKGDIEKGFAEADFIIKKTYSTSMGEHIYLEPDAGVAWIDNEGRIVVYASSQDPHYDQREIARSLGLESSRVRVIQATTGGSFGSKHDATIKCFLALAVYHLRRPVRLVYSREEVFLATPKRHSFTITYKTGARKNGKLLAVEADIMGDTGAYSSYGVAVASKAAVHATGPYEVPNVSVRARVVYTNHPISGAMRGFGVPQVAFAHESQMDLLAEKLGMSPVDLRLLNCLRPGLSTSTGHILHHSVGIAKTLEIAKEHYLRLKQEGSDSE